MQSPRGTSSGKGEALRCHLKEFELLQGATGNTKGCDMWVRKWHLQLSPSGFLRSGLHFLGEGLQRVLSSVGSFSQFLQPPRPPTPTHRIHGETGSIPVQGAAKLLQFGGKSGHLSWEWTNRPGSAMGSGLAGDIR